MTLVLDTFNGTGNDASGNSGDSNRILTLNNTGMTSQAGLLVYVSGLALALTSEYTISHLSSETKITFLNGLWDDMVIVVKYHQNLTVLTNVSIKRADFQNIITENGKELILTRQTKTTDSVGNTTAISEENYTIWVLIQDITKKDRQIHEMGLAITGNSKAFFFHEYSDEITGNGVLSVEPGDILNDGVSWRIETMLGERQMDGEEIFRTGVIKSIDLN